MSLWKKLWERYVPLSSVEEVLGSPNETPSFASPGAPETPYTRAQGAWDARMGSLVLRARNWRWLSFLLAISLILMLGLLYRQSGKPAVKPMIVEVEAKSGQVRQIVDVSQLPFELSESVKRHFLWRWIQNIREVSSDPVLINSRSVEAFHFMTNRGNKKFVEFFNEHNPFTRCQAQETVALEWVSMHRMTDQTYYVQWKEKSYRAGHQESEQLWSSTLTIQVVPPKDESVLAVNPVGLWIDDFSFSRVENLKG